MTIFFHRYAQINFYRLTVLFFDDVSLRFEDGIKILKGQVSVELLYFRLVLRVRVAALAFEALVLFFRLIQLVQIIILHISPAQFVGQFVLNYLLRFRLHLGDYEAGALLIKRLELIFLFDELLFVSLQVILRLRIRFLALHGGVLLFFFLFLLRRNFIHDHFVQVVIYV